MTIRKRETEIRNQLSRKLRAISSCNQELLRADDEQTLLDKICWIICEEAGYRMAWVGYAEHDDAKTVRPRAWAGAEQGYLSQQGITWSDRSERHRPLGLAIRSGKPVYVQDLASEDESASWSAHALSRGFHSTIALPLKDEKANTFGVLCIYSGQRNAFTSDEINLLEELAADLAFGITSLRLRAERIETELRLVASEQVFRTLVENSPDYVARYDQQLRRIYINPALQKMFTVPVAELLGTTPIKDSPTLDPEHYMRCIRRVIKSGREFSDELPYRSPEGDSRWANIRFAPEFGPDGKVVSVLAISRDITERKQAEEERQAHLYFLESLDRINRILQGEGDLDQIMNYALEAVLDIFSCDRAYLVYPCDPNSATWTVPIERTRPEFPGAGQLGPQPMNDHVAFVMQVLLDSDHPIRLGPGAEFPVPEILLEQFNIHSNMAMILHPRVDKPWQFGIHQCSRDRVWSDREVRLFEEIGRRLSDGLNNLLIARDLRESEGRFRLVFENSPLPIREEDFSAVKSHLEKLRPEFGDDLEGYLENHPEIVDECAALVRIVDVNRASLVFHGAKSKEALMRELSLIFIPETMDTLRLVLLALMRGETDFGLESEIKTLTGRRQHVSIYFSVCSGHEQTLSKVLVSLVDITKRKRSEERLRLAASVFANSQEGILISDAENRIIDINPAFTRLTGYTRDDAIGQNPHFLSAGRQSQEFYAEMWRSININGEWQGELWNRHKSGEEYVELLSIVAVKDEQNRLQHYVGAFSDISMIKEHEADLDRIAHFDMLTSVPNRRLLGDRMEQAIARTHRSGKSVAVCYLDLDGFKPINDQFGHEGGDRMLVEIARRLESMLRSDDTVARLGGDEFVLLWNDISAEAECHFALERILTRISAPMLLEGEEVSVSASIGVTLYPEDNVDADNLLRHADHAMYSAKQLGKNRYQMFDARLERQISSRVEFLAKVEKALNDEQFELYYQPKVNCIASTVEGVEALLRWNDPILGLVGPKEFLSLIENDSLAFRMGRWVIEQAVRQARIWDEMDIKLPVSINLFPRHLKYRAFIDDLRNAITLHWPHMPMGRLMMEIIETTDLEELDPVELVIKKCLEMGVSFSLDDFGTGYSSLIYLRRLSVEELKIDQAFVRDMLEDPDDEAIVVGVIGLGRAFGLRVVAEGVESPQQARHLVDLGCPIVQGYGMGRPMSAEDFQEWYANFQVNGVNICR